MKKKNKNINKKVNINISNILDKLSRKKKMIIMFIMIIISILGGTFAWFSYQSKKSALVLTIGDLNDSQVIITPYEIRDTMLPVNSYLNGVYSQITVINNNDSKLEFKLYYKVNTLPQELTQNGLKYTIVQSDSKDGTYTEVLTNDFSNYSSELEIDIFDIIIGSNTTTYYRLYLWLDSSVGNQTVLENYNLDLELNANIFRSANPPVLDSGMIPVTISNDGIVTTISSNDDSWYDYSNQEWANAILVTESSRSSYLNTTGVVVQESDILGYYVWIPRYKYKIWTTSVSSTGNEQEIDIIFESKNATKSNGTTIGSYLTHSAFTFGNQELSGFWVGKFETTGSASTPTVLPNVASLKYQNVSTQFQTSLKFAGGTLSDGNVTFTDNPTYGLTSNTDSHMMKNSEWGAVAYLSHSKYGINTEIRINNNSSYITGCGASTENGSETTTCEIQYGNATEYPQSTTGNITGIYDMSGGSWEYVMGVYSDSDGNPRSGYSSDSNSGFNGVIYDSGDNTSYTSGIDFPSSKYYDLYNITSNSSCTLATCGGHALYETVNWYSDSSIFVDSSYPWFLRGGNWYSGSSAGVFNSSYGNGGIGNTNYSWRSVLAPVDTIMITYDANGGTGTMSNTTYTYGDGSITLPTNTYTKTGYTFNGWHIYNSTTDKWYGCTDTSVGCTGNAGNTTLGWHLEDEIKSYYQPKSGWEWVTNNSTDNLVFYAQWRINKVYFNFHVNNGTITSSTSSTSGTVYTWTTSNGIIYRSVDGGTSTKDFWSVNYNKTDVDLPNWDYSRYINISRTGYTAKSGEEWICTSGCSTADKAFSDTTNYSASDFCDATNGDCTVVLKVNWKVSTVNITYDGNGGYMSEDTKTYTSSGEYSYTIPKSSYYQLEVWGASGGYAKDTSHLGGYGGYSNGTIFLNSGTIIYINVGGKGTDSISDTAGLVNAGGYNGGGNGVNFKSNTGRYIAGGGGATHIATISGVLSTLSSNISSILIVAGGGAGNGYYTSSYYTFTAGSGGGFQGTDGIGYYDGTKHTSDGGTQTTGNAFGVGKTGEQEIPGGGGGYYGGKGNFYRSGGGSGYISNSSLINKYMYCYNCETSDEESTKTYKTINVSSTPISNYAKSGDGAAKISLVNESITKTITSETYGDMPAITKGDYVLKGWNTKQDGTGTYVTSSSSLISTSAHTLYAIWQESNIPLCSISATENSTTLTATYSSNSGVVGYYFGTSPPTSNTSFTSMTSSTSGTKTGTVSSTGTYYFGFKDSVGNVGYCNGISSSTTTKYSCGGGCYPNTGDGLCYKYVNNTTVSCNTQATLTYTCSSGTKLSDNYCWS